jgi:hypothetical protein
MRFFSELKKLIFPFIVALSALSVSLSAAFYSVTGLSKLFAGASFEVLIMASSLEIAKLVIASLLYQYWNEINKLLRFYLTTAAIVLVAITSMGIYGFLSAAYQETAALAGSVDSQIELIETKRDNVKEQLEVYNEEKSSINQAVADLREGLSNNKIQYRDRETGEIITTTSSSTRKALEKQLDQAIERQTEINTRVDNLNQQLFDYETEIVEVSTSSEVGSELGPLKYISGLTGKPMDQIVNYLLLIIIFVFDPLAISLVIAANFMFSLNSKNRKSDDFIDEKPIIEEEIKEPIIEEEIIEPNENLKELKERYDKEVESSDIFEVENVYGDVEIHNVEDSEESNEPIIDETDIIEPVVIEQQKNNKRLVYKKRNDSN